MSTTNKIAWFLSGGILCSSLLFLCGTDSKKEISNKPVVTSFIQSVEVPQSVVFCDQVIDLTPYDRHERFDREINSFSYLHATTMLLFKRANRYFPIIEPILKANGIPDDFKYLAVIESHLDAKALSPAKAAGMWQFIPSAAKEKGLRIVDGVDERYHIEKSTEAACKYLKAAYAKYGDWPSVAASYNGGMGRISGELNKQDADTALDLWLVEETSRYPYRIMAIKSIFENPYKYGFVLKKDQLYKPVNFKTVIVDKDIPDLAVFAKEHGITYSQLKQFNLWLRDRKLITNGYSYEIQIPDVKELSYATPNKYAHNKNWVVD